MFGKRSAAQKRYIDYMRKDIYDTAAKFKKRYQIFPWSKINQLSKLKSEQKVKVFNTDFTVKELLLDIKKTKARIKTKSEPKFYFSYLNGFVRDLRGMDDEHTKELYNTINERLQNEFKTVEMDLEFCLASLKALNSLLKEESITNESMNDELVEIILSITEGRKDIEDMSTILNEMTESVEMTEYYEAVLEAEEAMDEADELQEELTTEGANYDMYKLLKQYKREFKKLRKDFNTFLKENRFKEARKAIDDMEKEMDYYYRKVLDVDSTIFETQIGNIIHSIIYTAKMIILAPANFITFGMVKEYQDAKENLIQRTHTANSLKDAKKDRVSSNAFNKYKNDVLDAVDKNKKVLRKLDKMVDKAEAIYKKEQAKTVKESAEYKDAVKELYESCSAGKITIEEREELLAELDKNVMVADEIARVDNSMMAKEKYDAVVKALYARCQAGEITVDERELLIEKAKKDIFQIKDEKPNFLDSQESVDDNQQKPIDPKAGEKMQQNIQKETEKITNDMGKEMDKVVNGK